MKTPIALTLEFPNIRQKLNYINEIIDKNPSYVDIDRSKIMNQLPQNNYRQEFERAIGILSKITSRSSEEIKPHLEALIASLNQTKEDDLAASSFYATSTHEQWSAEFHKWLDSHKKKDIPVLSEEAMSRESMYPDRW